MLSPELAAGIRRVKGMRRLGVRVGNWLTAEQGKRLLDAARVDTLRGKRNHAMLNSEFDSRWGGIRRPWTTRQD